MFSSLLIEASAGSGKTFQLSNRFLALLALGEDPADLIALTFTRKAAGEFTRRILNRLALGASSEEEAAKLAQALTLTLIGDPATRQPGIIPPSQLPDLGIPRFRELLVSLVKTLDRFQLSTLDSFFTRLVNSFGPELGLAGFEMLDEDRFTLAREDTLQNVLNGGAFTQTQRELFLSAFIIANYGNEEARVRDSILQFVEDHHERILQCPLSESWGNPHAIWEDFGQWPKFSPTKLAALQQRILDALPEKFGHGSFDKTVRNTVTTITDYVPGTPLPDPLKKNLFKWVDSLAEGADEIHFKAYKKDMVFPVRLTSLLVELEALIRYSEIEVFLRRTQGIWAVVTAFEQQYNQQNRSQGRVSFGDLTLLLQQHAVLARETGFNELAYRLDSKFRHWMLDEFQDTSRKQWQVIEPVIDEAVNDQEGQRSLFVVGDTKQSIYGWRGGEPRLFEELVRPSWDRLEQWTMARSWRSSQIILDFVNLVCDTQGNGMQPFPDATKARWKFENHRAAKKLSGSVKVYQFDTKKDEQISPKEAALIEEIQSLKPTQRGLSCAILVGSNKQVQNYTALLRQHTNFAIEAEAAVSIASDSPLGLALLDWFTYLLTPLDSFARRHVETSPLCEAIRQFGEDLNAQYTEARSEIAAQGVSFHINKLISALPKSVQLKSFQKLRLQQILDTARNFDSTGGSLEEWLRMLKKQTHREESGSGAIQIMTVHKSKGLEFDIVMLPELDGDSYDVITRMGMLKMENAEHLPKHFMLKPAKEIVQRDPHLQAQYDQWVADNCYERACNFYVALTRAARSLYLFLKAPASSKNSAADKLNDAGWIHRSVGDINTQSITLANEVEGSLLYQSGSPAWYLDHPVSESLATKETTSIQLPPAAPRIGRRTASKEKSSHCVNRNSRSMQGGKDFGNQVHALFEQITNVADKDTLPNNSYGDTVKAALELPESRHWFDAQPNTEVLLEQPVESIDASGTWFSGMIDRAIVHFDEAQNPINIEILDFKTDKVDSAEELMERYEGQMRSYISVLSSAYKLPISAISATLLSTKLNTYVELPSH